MTVLSVADPRPQLLKENGAPYVKVWRCVSCSYVLAQPVLRCPECRETTVVEEAAGPRAKVQASTCIRVNVPGQQKPYSLAYIIFPKGPRILVHTPGDTPLPLHSEVILTGQNENGDITAKLEDRS